MRIKNPKLVRRPRVRGAPMQNLDRSARTRRRKSSGDLGDDAEGMAEASTDMRSPREDDGGAAAGADWPEEYWMSYTPLDDAYRSNWISSYGNTRGSFDDETKLKPMRYTLGPDLPDSVSPMDTVQFFSVRVAVIKKGLRWPLHVYGVVAVRDSVDHLRNIIFRRDRDNPQPLASEEDSFLELQGPTRAIVLIDPAVFEVDLKVKGDDGQTDDIALASLVFYHDNTPYRDDSHLETLTELTEHCTMEFKFAEIVNAVEATIQVRVTEGSRDFRARFFARTASINEDFVLLDSKDKKVIVAGDDGLILFQRSVAVVEERGELVLGVEAVHEVEEDGGGATASTKTTYPFSPRIALRSKGGFDLGFCKMDITVAWSMLP